MRSALALLTCIGLSLAQSVDPLAQIITSGNDVLLKLDYATYRGYHNSTNEVYTFRNIRFAASPTGELRWQKPVPPGKVSEVQDRQEPIACTQPPSDKVQTVGGAVVGKGSEDCLFLDLTIPEKVVRSDKKEKVPVLIWVHGGFYSKFYDFSWWKARTDVDGVQLKAQKTKEVSISWPSYPMATLSQSQPITG